MQLPGKQTKITKSEAILLWPEKNYPLIYIRRNLQHFSLFMDCC